MKKCKDFAPASRLPQLPRGLRCASDPFTRRGGGRRGLRIGGTVKWRSSSDEPSQRAGRRNESPPPSQVVERPNTFVTEEVVQVAHRRRHESGAISHRKAAEQVVDWAPFHTI